MNKESSRYFNTAVRMDEAFLSLLEEKPYEFITVKEVCKRAEVNRSTFYLHYEGMADLLAEAGEYILKELLHRYEEDTRSFIEKIPESPLEDLFLVTPKYIMPYLEFLTEHRKILKITMTRPKQMNSDTAFKNMFYHIFSPIMTRFGIKEEDREYKIRFYLSGMIAVISRWLQENCVRPKEEIARILMECILPPTFLEKYDGYQN